jgi:DNA polymerase III sliding clamp (beta) subunit (PCNA family)
MYAVRFYTGEYPSLEPIFKKEETQKVIFPKALADGIEKVLIFSGGDNRIYDTSTIEMSRNKCVLKSRNSMGWDEETYKADYTGSPFSFMINPALLDDALKHSSSIDVGKTKIYIETEKLIHAAALQFEGH